MDVVKEYQQFAMAVLILVAYWYIALFDTGGADKAQVLTTLQNALVMAVTFYFQGKATASNGNGNGHS